MGQASRISTYLHRHASLGVISEDEDPRREPWPCAVFCGDNMHAGTARTLMFLIVPGQVIFLFAIRALAPDEQGVGVVFSIIYLAAALVQVWLLLYVCLHLVYFQWRRGTDPDSAAVPYLTAIGDLCGTALLAITFWLLSVVDEATGVEDPEVKPMS